LIDGDWTVLKVLLLFLGLGVMGNYLYHLMGLDWSPSVGGWNRKVTRICGARIPARGLVQELVDVKYLVVEIDLSLSACQIA
jgi:hypothetical protein